MTGSAARGFAGLATLVSDVTVDIADAERLSHVERTVTPTVAPVPEVPVVRAPLGGTFGSILGGAKALVGIVVGLGILALIGSLVNHPSAPPVDVTSEPSSSAPSVPPATPLPAPWWQNVPDTSTPPSPGSATQPPAASQDSAQDLSEEQPPAGTDLLLTASQIRYCLAEDIRLQTIKAIMQTQRDSVRDVDRFNRAVDRFNARVTDYNSRCSQFRYYRETYEHAREQVEAERGTIENQARSQWDAEP